MTAELVAHVAAGLLLVMLGAVGAFFGIAKAIAVVVRELRNEAKKSIQVEACRDFGPYGKMWYYEDQEGWCSIGWTRKKRKP